MKFYKINQKDIELGMVIDQTRIPIHIMSEIYIKTSKQKKFKKIEEVFKMSIIFSEDIKFIDELSGSVHSHGEILYYTFIKENQNIQLNCPDFNNYIQLKDSLIHIEVSQKNNKIKCG